VANAINSDRLICSLDRPFIIYFLLTLSASQYQRAGQANLGAVGIRQASPLVIKPHAVRAILLARATATNLRGRRSNNSSNKDEAALLPCLT